MTEIQGKSILVRVSARLTVWSLANCLTSPTKNSSLFGSHRAAMAMITSELRKAQVPSRPSVDSYLVVTLFLCIFTSASFGIEILVFRIRICDVTLSSNWRFHLEFCGRLWLHCWRLSGLLEWRRWIEFKSCNLHFSWNGDSNFNIRDVEFSLYSFNLFKVTSSSNDAISTAFIAISNSNDEISTWIA